VAGIYPRSFFNNAATSSSDTSYDLFRAQADRSVVETNAVEILNPSSWGGMSSVLTKALRIFVV
jgi:hypothetical protein